ncbi:MAG: IS3 family transposase, partial [Cellulosilyticaceae bacterium]
MGLGRLRKEGIYQAIQEAHEKYDYSIRSLCQIGKVTRAAYYKWVNRKTPDNEKENVRISKVIETIHEQHPDKGYRRIKDDLERYHSTKVNDKRVLRICRRLNIKSTIKYASQGCTRQAANPQHIAENVLNREFKADKPNEKWLTDVTEFKYYIDGEKKKMYLSAIIDLYDRRIVSHVLSDRNDNALVFETFDLALQAAPDVTPLFHSDRGFQYTNRSFYKKLMSAGMTQSMSRVGKCIDNGPIEGFWGILKRERYYGKKFTTKESL